MRTRRRLSLPKWEGVISVWDDVPVSVGGNRPTDMFCLLFRLRAHHSHPRVYNIFIYNVSYFQARNAPNDASNVALRHAKKDITPLMDKCASMLCVPTTFKNPFSLVDRPPSFHKCSCCNNNPCRRRNNNKDHNKDNHQRHHHPSFLSRNQCK
jgi:hypothetical protein